MSGASWATTFRRVSCRAQPGLIAGWIYIVIVSIRELSSSILLYAGDRGPVDRDLGAVENGQYVELSALGVMSSGLVRARAACPVGRQEVRHQGRVTC